MTEHDIEKTKETIIHSIEQTNDENKLHIVSSIMKTENKKLLMKVGSFFELDAEEYETTISYIRSYFTDRCGFTKSIVDNLMQKIKHYGMLKLCRILFVEIEGDSDYEFLTVNSLLSNDNIFDLIKKYTKSVICKSNEYTYKDIEEEFDAFIKSIANFNIGGKVATGKMEFLTIMFLKDLNLKNTPSLGFGLCDINAKNCGLEYKISGARIQGNLEQSKPFSFEKSNKHFIRLVTERLSNNSEAEQFLNELSTMNNIFRNSTDKEVGQNTKEVLEKIYELGISSFDINEMIIDSLNEQFKIKFITNDDKRYIIENYPVIHENKHINLDNLKTIWLVLHLCNYWKAERWDWLVLFDKDSNNEMTGKYVLIEKPDETDIVKSMNRNMNKSNKVYSASFPCYGKGTNDQNQSPMIKYKKQH